MGGPGDNHGRAVAEPGGKVVGRFDENRFVVGSDHYQSWTTDLMEMAVDVVVESGLNFVPIIFGPQRDPIHIEEELSKLRGNVALGTTVTDAPSQELDFDHAFEITGLGSDCRF